MVDERKVSYEQGAALAKSNGISFVEVSAKTSDKIEDTFKKPAENILNKIENGIIKVDNNTVGIKHGTSNQCNTSNIPLTGLKDVNDKKKNTCC
jgi:Zn-dependent M16 (insulinase) family peptidase